MWYNGNMRPDISNFGVVRYFGEPPDAICDKIGSNTRVYGLRSVCEECDFRFACVTGNLMEVVGVDIESEYEVTEFGSPKKQYVRC